MSKSMLHTKAEVVRDSVKPEEGIIEEVVGSTSVLDRAGDTIDQSGWDLRNFKKNPVILWGHNVKEERAPIGKALKVWIKDKGTKKAQLLFKVKFDLQDSFAADIFRKIKEGFINTVSVGFLPSEWEELQPDNFFGGRKYTKQELLELSFVPVPANPEATIALRSMSKKDDRFSPVELEKMYKEKGEDFLLEEVGKEEIEKPYPNEHACRLQNPDDFKSGSFRSMTRTHDGKEYRVIMGKLKGEDSMTDQSFRYKKDVWSESSAKTHCKNHGGSFEAASSESAQEEEDVKEEKVKEEVKEEKKEIKKVKKVKKEKVEEQKEEKEVIEDKPKEQEEEVVKGVIPYKDLGILPESENWDGPGEKAKADVSDLKLICAWFDSANADNKGAYKLPHHKADGHKAVWRGVAAAMAALLGARGGASIPEGDRKGVYNHLKKHYKQFDKEAPEFKMVENQVLAGLDEELLALTLEREDKYVVRLVKKVLKKQKKTPKAAPTGYTDEQVAKALEVITLALSLYSKSSQKGGK